MKPKKLAKRFKALVEEVETLSDMVFMLYAREVDAETERKTEAALSQFASWNKAQTVELAH